MGKYFIRFRCAWSVGRFTDDLCLHPWGIIPVDHILQSCRDQDITIQFQCIGIFFQVGGSGKIQDCSSCLAVLEYFFLIQALGIINSSLIFSQSDYNSPVLPKEFSAMVPHITKPLYYNSLPFDTRSKALFFHHISHITYLANTVENTQTGGFRTSAYTPLRYGLPGNTSGRIDLSGLQGRIGIHDPGHFPRTRTIIRRRNVDTRTDKILFNQFRSISTGDLLQFIFAVFSGIDLDTTLGSSKRYINNGAFVGHQAGQGHHFILIHFITESDTPFAGRFVMTMLHPVSFDDFNIAIVPLYGKTHLVNTVAGLDLFQYPKIPFGKFCRLVEAPFHTLEKTVGLCCTHKIGFI